MEGILYIYKKMNNDINIAFLMIFNSFNFIILYPLLFLAYYVILAKFVRLRKYTSLR